MQSPSVVIADFHPIHQRITDTGEVIEEDDSESMTASEASKEAIRIRKLKTMKVDKAIEISAEDMMSNRKNFTENMKGPLLLKAAKERESKRSLHSHSLSSLHADTSPSSTGEELETARKLVFGVPEGCG